MGDSANNAYQSSLDVLEALIAFNEPTDANPTTSDSGETSSDAINSENVFEMLLNSIQIEQNEQEEALSMLNPSTSEAVEGTSSSITDTINEVAQIEDISQINENAFKLFAQAMSYTKPGTTTNTHYKQNNRIPVNPSIEMNTTDPELPPVVRKRRYTKYERSEGLVYPRSKHIDEASVFVAGTTEEKYREFREKMDTERNKVFDDIIQKDVEHLLSSANRIYGHRNWSRNEKREFEKFCRILRLRGSLTTEEKNELKGFYAKAYNLTEVVSSTGEKDYVFLDEEKRQRDVLKNFKERHNRVTDSQMKRLYQKTYEEIKRDSSKRRKQVEKVEQIKEPEPIEEPQNEATSSTSSTDFSTVFTTPADKLTAEKLFRDETIQIFERVMSTDLKLAKKRGRPSRSAGENVLNEWEKERQRFENAQKVEHIGLILQQAAEKYGFHYKVWADEEIKEFEKFYSIYKVRQHFTLTQARELYFYYKKAFGMLESFELEREKDEKLQEKKKYWQEYRRQYYLNKKAGVATTKPKKAKPVESEVERKRRKAAYLRDWRSKKAQEKEELLCGISDMILTAAATANTLGMVKNETA